MAGTIIYTKTGCPYCQRALQEYRQKGVPFTEVNISEDRQALQMIKEKYNASKVPVIVQDGKVVSIGYQGGG